MDEILNGWAEWKPNHLVNDTLNDPKGENLSAYIEWAFHGLTPDRYKQAINRLYSWCYIYPEFLEGIDLVVFNTRFKRATEDYLKKVKDSYK